MGATQILMTIVVAVGFFQPASQRRDPLEYIRILESAERVKMLQVPRVVESLGVRPGDKIVDLGAGSGLFTRPLAKLAGPEGLVYAVDIDQDLLNHIDESAREQGLRNIRTVLAGEYDPRIPEQVDLILICDTLHHIGDPSKYLRGLVRYLKPGSRVAVIDYEAEWPSRFHSVQYTPLDLDRWMAAADLTLRQEFDFLRGNFFRIYGLD